MILFLLALVAAENPAPPPAQPAKKTARTPDTVVCKRMPVMGSLAQTKKICQPQRDWDQEAATARASTRGGGACNVEGVAGC